LTIRFFGFPAIAAYCASKGGLSQLTRVLAVENIQHGIRVNAVGAGDVVTNLLNHFMPGGREFLDQHGKNAPIGHAAQPEEIAEVVAFLASERASFLVDSVVMADGGYSVQVTAPSPPNTGDLSKEELREATRLYSIKCARCHKFYDPADYGDAEWRTWMNKMSRKARLKADQAQLLSRYLETFRTAQRSDGKDRTP